MPERLRYIFFCFGQGQGYWSAVQKTKRFWKRVYLQRWLSTSHHSFSQFTGIHQSGRQWYRNISELTRYRSSKRENSSEENAQRFLFAMYRTSILQQAYPIHNKVGIYIRCALLRNRWRMHTQRTECTRKGTRGLSECKCRVVHYSIIATLLGNVELNQFFYRRSQAST